MQAPLDDLFDLSPAHFGKRHVERRTTRKLGMRSHHETRRRVGIGKRAGGQRVETSESFRGFGDLQIGVFRKSGG